MATPMFLECKLDDANNPIKFDKPELLENIMKQKQVRFQVDVDGTSHNETEGNKSKSEGQAD